MMTSSDSLRTLWDREKNVVLGLLSCGCHLFSAMSRVEHWRKGMCSLSAYSPTNATPRTWKVQSQQEELSLAFAQVIFLKENQVIRLNVFSHFMLYK